MDIPTIIIDGKKYIRMYISCPMCSKKDHFIDRSFWKHANGCNGNIFIGEDAFCYCDKCQTRSHILNWQFICDGHLQACNENSIPPKTRYDASIANCTAIAGEMVKDAGLSWLKSFVVGLSNYIAEHNSNLCIEPYTHTEDEVSQTAPVDDNLDTFEVPNEENHESPQKDNPEYETRDNESIDPIEGNFRPEGTSNDNSDIDSTDFDESSFFERFSNKNN